MFFSEKVARNLTGGAILIDVFFGWNVSRRQGGNSRGVFRLLYELIDFFFGVFFFFRNCKKVFSFFFTKYFINYNFYL